MDVVITSCLHTYHMLCAKYHFEKIIHVCIVKLLLELNST